MKSILCVGAYLTSDGADGIRLFDLDTETGALTARATVSNRKNPSFIAFSSDRRFAYACQELPEEASIAAYRLSRDGCDWEPINEVRVPGTGMCHVTVSPGGKHLLCANFTTGNVACCQILPDGALGEVTCALAFEGCSVRTDWFQDRSRCHECVFTPDGKRVIVCDMGADMLRLFMFDEETGVLTPNPTQPEIPCEPGDGPRHLAFAPGTNRMYAVMEISCVLAAYEYDPASGRFTCIQRLPTLPAHIKTWRTASEIMIPRNKRFVFVANRGTNLISRFDMNANGALAGPTAYFDGLGEETRMFCFTPDERYMVIANQKSNRVHVCPYDAQTGNICAPVNTLETALPAFVEVWNPREKET